MPVLVSLLDLVSVPNTRPVWPAELRDAVGRLEAADDRTQAGELADWLDEHGESVLADGFRYLANHLFVTWASNRDSYSLRVWRLDGLPPVLYHTVLPPDTVSDWTTLAGAAASLGRRINKAREDLK